MSSESYIGVDMRIPGWMEKGYIHEKLVKKKDDGRWCHFVLKNCPEDIKKELREQNIYLFEEDLKKEDIVFWCD